MSIFMSVQTGFFGAIVVSSLQCALCTACADGGMLILHSVR